MKARIGEQSSARQEASDSAPIDEDPLPAPAWRQTMRLSQIAPAPIRLASGACVLCSPIYR